jgi:hypothetical protein
MTQDIIEMARQVRFGTTLTHDGEIGHFINGSNYLEELEAFYKLAVAKERETYMQLFLDPENQPTQFGTATQEYRTQEIQEIQSLLTEIANIVRTKHIYGPEMKKLLAKEEAIRARGQA